MKIYLCIYKLFKMVIIMKNKKQNLSIDGTGSYNWGRAHKYTASL